MKNNSEGSSGLDTKLVTIFGLGLVAAFSAFQVFSISRQLERQNDKLMDLAMK